MKMKNKGFHGVKYDVSIVTSCASSLYDAMLAANLPARLSAFPSLLQTLCQISIYT